MGLSRICAGAERKLCKTCPFFARETLTAVGDIEDLCRYQPANQRNQAAFARPKSIDSTKIIKKKGYAAVKLATTCDISSPLAKQQRRYMSLAASRSEEMDYFVKSKNNTNVAFQSLGEPIPQQNNSHCDQLKTSYDNLSSKPHKVTLADLTKKPPSRSSSKKRNITPFSSSEGRVMFKEALQQGYQEAYFKLSEQYQTLSRETSEQSKGSGIASLTMVLNALGIDPLNSACITTSPIWKGVWRWFSNDMVSGSVSRISKSEDFSNIARKALIESKDCNVASFKASSLTSFRMHIQTTVSAPSSFLVVAFNKNSIFDSKTAECPFFSPIASYHPGTDSVLILDVDRENTQPYWLPLRSLHETLFGYTIVRREDSVNETTGVAQIVKAIQSSVRESKDFERAVRNINTDIEATPGLKHVISQTKTHEHLSSSTPDAFAYTALMLSHPRDILLQGLPEKQQAFLWWMKKSDTKSVLHEKSDWLVKWNKQLSLIC